MEARNRHTADVSFISVRRRIWDMRRTHPKSFDPPTGDRLVGTRAWNADGRCAMHVGLEPTTYGL